MIVANVMFYVAIITNIILYTVLPFLLIYAIINNSARTYIAVGLLSMFFAMLGYATMLLGFSRIPVISDNATLVTIQVNPLESVHGFYKLIVPTYLIIGLLYLFVGYFLSIPRELQ